MASATTGLLTHPAGRTRRLVPLSFNRYILVGVISKELQSGNGCYAFNASFREILRYSAVAYDLRLSAAVRTIPRSHSCRGSVLTRGCHTIRMWKPCNSDGARTMRT